MNSSPIVVRVGVALVCTGACLALGAGGPALLSPETAAQIALTPLHGTGVYGVGEKVGWEVEVLGLGSASVTQARYTLKRNGLTAYQQGVLDLRIVCVDLRLTRKKIVQIVLATPRIPGPRRSTKHRLPVCWW